VLAAPGRLPRLLPRRCDARPAAAGDGGSAARCACTGRCSGCCCTLRRLPLPPAATKVTYAADAFFDFDKAVLKPEGKAKLDDLVGKIKGINLEVIIAVGHTDSVGSDAYNQKLSVRRAEAVKAYLVSKGIEKNRVYTEGKGEKQPSPTTRPPKAAPRTAAWKSKWLVPAPTSNLRIASEKPQQRGFFYGFEENRFMTQTLNVDPAELAKFSDLAHRWWDPESEFRPLHQINPLRLEWINGLAPLAGKRVLDVGCGGGILADAMARKGADVLGIDLSSKSLKVAQLHALGSPDARCRLPRGQCRGTGGEQAGSFDVVTCMEMLEHVPDPASIVRACATLVKPGGWVFFSTLNRNPNPSCSRSWAPSTCSIFCRAEPTNTQDGAPERACRPLPRRPAGPAGHPRHAVQPAHPPLLAQQRHQRQLPLCHPQSRRRGLKPCSVTSMPCCSTWTAP
jgi:2-polyprenyl-3-methyl-5-hydroxy-6-metoxy-1,4-benzoquinol methylase/outer membrane protein OmpA-like peptidoglycan-associated protein